MTKFSYGKFSFSDRWIRLLGLNFSYFFSFSCGWDTNSRSEVVTVWKRIQFCIFSFSCSTLRTNFSYGKFSFSDRWIRLLGLNFSYFFSFSCGWDTNSPSEVVTVWKRIQFCIFSFPCSTLMTKFSYGKFSFSDRWIRLLGLNFSYFSVSRAVETQILQLKLWQFERELNSASSPFLVLLWWRSFHTENFNFLTGVFVCWD